MQDTEATERAQVFSITQTLFFHAGSISSIWSCFVFGKIIPWETEYSFLSIQ